MANEKMKVAADPQASFAKRGAVEARSWGLIALIIAVAVGVGIVGWWFSRPGDVQQRGGRRSAFGMNVPVATAVVAAGDIHINLSALGTVTPLATVTVHSRVDGELQRVAFREGQLVNAGDLLAEIDPRPFQAQLTQAQGALARDQAQLANAKIDLERYQTLFEQDSIAKQQLDAQKSLVQQYEGGIKADQGQIDNDKLQITYSRVTAPISGRTGLRQVDAGNIVHAGDSNGIVVITQLTPISVLFTLPEDSLQSVLAKMHAGVELAVEAYDRSQSVKLAVGKLTTLDNQIDASTGTVKAKAQFDNADESLFPNQFVNVRVLLDTLHAPTVIPTSALQRGADGLYVYIVNNDKTVAVRAIKTGPAEGERVAVESGLNAGDLVVTDGGDKLREGAKVELPAEAGSTPALNSVDAPAKADNTDGAPRQRGQGRHRPAVGNGERPSAAPGAANGDKPD